MKKETIFLSYTAEFKNRLFSCCIPERVNTPIHMSFLENPDFHRFSVYKPLDPNAVLSTKCTCEQLLDIIVNKKAFFDTNDMNFLEIFFLLDNYLNEISPLILQQNYNVIVYTKKVLQFREKLYKKCIVVVHRNKYTKEKLIAERPNDVFFKMLLNDCIIDKDNPNLIFREAPLYTEHYNAMEQVLSGSSKRQLNKSQGMSDGELAHVLKANDSSSTNNNDVGVLDGDDEFMFGRSYR